MKKIISAILYVTLLCSGSVNAQQIRPQGSMKELFSGPIDQNSRDKWLDSVKIWRSNEKARLKYNNSEYKHPGLSWIKKTFIYAQMMAHDRYFFDEVKKVYTVDRYLDDLKKRFGGLDAVLIWPTYPNIGVDNRNQYDLVADMPGGKEAVRQMIRDFKKRGVRVFFPIMVWDHGTKKLNCLWRKR
ncbi:hypothetical protein [Dyadobacter sp. NIV53]|uniref:hypothetical protein n=1 Tax=Dyadobacter sp. NIV53 TaxID=2861765 RepID=UPI001C886BE7|nr:hypothetical protein [Dyadobacter sp. NIV53]